MLVGRRERVVAEVLWEDPCHVRDASGLGLAVEGTPVDREDDLAAGGLVMDLLDLLSDAHDGADPIDECTAQCGFVRLSFSNTTTRELP